jgi:hypothetical protein
MNETANGVALISATASNAETDGDGKSLLSRCPLAEAQGSCGLPIVQGLTIRHGAEAGASQAVR